MKNGQSKDLRKVTFYDSTGRIEMSFWGNTVDLINFEENEAIMVKGALVKDY